MAAYNNPGAIVKPKNIIRKTVTANNKEYLIMGGYIYDKSVPGMREVARYTDNPDTIIVSDFSAFTSSLINKIGSTFATPIIWVVNGIKNNWDGSRFVSMPTPATGNTPADPGGKITSPGGDYVASDMTPGQMARRITDEQKKAYDAAYNANMARWNEATGLYKEMYTTDMQGLGQQQYRDIGQQYRKLGGQLQQDMVSKGLTGTTIAPTMRTSLKTNEIADRNRVAEANKQTMLGYKSQYAAHLGTANDVYPDPSRYYQNYKDLGYFAP